MKNKLIIIIAGEPKSVFLEVFFKAIKYKKYKSPLVLICNKKILNHHMKKNNFRKKINLIEINKIDEYRLNNNVINLIDVEFHDGKENEYLKNSFNLAFKIIKNGSSYKLINGPINKTSFLKKNCLTIL